MSHTPAPWYHRTFTSPNGNTCEFIEASYGSGARGDHYMSVSGCISKEDAVLITAAPELLEALETLVGELVEDGQEPNSEDLNFMLAITKARKALARAKGEA